MSEGTLGVPGLPTPNIGAGANLSTDVSAKNIFSLIKQSTSQSMSSVLPYVQAQFDQQSKAAAPQLAALGKIGEGQAASAISDAGARGMRGSDIEAAGVAGARESAASQQAEFLSKLSMQQAESMAGYIMKAHGYDIEANSQMYTNLAQAIGQELSQQREMEMRRQELAAMEKTAKKARKSSILASLISGVFTIGGAMLGPGGALAGKAVGDTVANKVG